jgi:type IV secretory pathway VirB4 component
MSITVVIVNLVTYSLPAYIFGIISCGLTMWLKTKKAIDESRKAKRELEKSEKELEIVTIELEKMKSKIKLEDQIKRDIDKLIPQFVRFYDNKRKSILTPLQIPRSELDDLLRPERIEVRDGIWKFLTESYDGIHYRGEYESFEEGFYLLPWSGY